MFRAAQGNPFDDSVGRATDENLTSENWEYILDVCDKVNAADTGGKDAVASMIKRLAHRNANVQIYTLELANALSQNCGHKIHKELASRSFTDALLRLANDRNSHTQVKAKILERMEEWSQMFSQDPDLGIMEQACTKLRSDNPSLRPPSKPFKQEITDADREKEDQELQMALALSVKDSKPPATQEAKDGPPSAEEAAGISQPAAAAAMPTGKTAATVSRVRALYDFVPSEAGELQFQRGDIIAVLESVYKDWWKGSLRGQVGIFPLNYVERLQDPTQDELQREAEMEAEVFGQIRNVEKLLALLSTSSNDMSARDNDEITSLYHSTLAIRPKLIELIGKYSQKKDDFTQLNEKFIKARRDYESLLEASMSQPAHGGYGRPPAQPQYGYPPAQQQYPPQQQQYPPQQQQYPPQQQGYYPPQQQAPPSHASTAPSQQQAYPDPSGPPRNGPAPFYMIPPGSQPIAAAGHDAPPPGPVDHNAHAHGYGQHDGAPGQGPPYVAGAPMRNPSTASRHSVQELAASQYDSPLDANAGQQMAAASVPSAPLQNEPSPYPAPLNVHHPHQAAAAPSYAPPPQPSYAPPSAPTPESHVAPGANAGSAPPPPHQQQPGVYQAYPGLRGEPSGGGGGGDDADSYYRTT